jgi:hypothetical protein
VTLEHMPMAVRKAQRSNKNNNLLTTHEKQLLKRCI